MVDYNPADAVDLIARKSGEKKVIVEAFMESYLHFRDASSSKSIATVSDGDDDGSVYVEGYEISTARLTEAVAYISAETELGESQVTRMLAEEIGYVASIGLVDPKAYPYFREWADWLARR